MMEIYVVLAVTNGVMGAYTDKQYAELFAEELKEIDIETRIVKTTLIGESTIK